MRRLLFYVYLFQHAPSLLAQTTSSSVATSAVATSLAASSEVASSQAASTQVASTEVASTQVPSTSSSSSSSSSSTEIAATTTIVATPVSSTTSSSSSIITSTSTSSLVTPSSITSSSSSISTATSGPQTLTIQVGANGFMYSPNTTYANPGDMVVFDFYPTNHSVIRGEYANNTEACGAAGCNPCVPWELYHEGEPYKGFFSSNEEIPSFNDRRTWNLTVNDTEPIFFYCDALTSCHPEGMVGVINPAKNQSLDYQRQKAVTADYQLAPGQTWPAEGTKTSSSSSSSSHHSHLSGGSIAGIVIGVAAFVCVAGALIFYIARTRTYDKVFRKSQIGGSSEAGEHCDASEAASPAWYKSPSLRVVSPPPPVVGDGLSPPVVSEKRPNAQRWSDITAMSGALGGAGQRHSTAPPVDGSSFVGYNRHTGAPEFAPELPGDSGISQLPGGSTAPMGSARSPVEMDASAAESENGNGNGSTRQSLASPDRRQSSQSASTLSPRRHFGFPGRMN